MSIVVYVASPYTVGNQSENVRRSIDMGEELTKHHFTPILPLLSHFWGLVHPHEWDFWMTHDLELVKRSDCVLRLKGESKGADLEVKSAREWNIPVYYTLDRLLLDTIPNIDPMSGKTVRSFIIPSPQSQHPPKPDPKNSLNFKGYGL